LGNQTALHVYKRARIEHQRSLTAMRELKIQIVKEIRNAVREVDLQLEKIEATRRSWQLSSERYKGEKKRLEAGLAIPYQVREAERNLLAETVAKTRALLDYQIARVRVDKAIGVLLSHFGLQK
jgi:outer membrane protein TolC